MAGNREKDGAKKRNLEKGKLNRFWITYFSFDFIDLAKELQPKVVIAENVKGLLLGNAKEYVRKIYREFDLSWLLLPTLAFRCFKNGCATKT